MNFNIYANDALIFYCVNTNMVFFFSKYEKHARAKPTIETCFPESEAANN